MALLKVIVVLATLCFVAASPEQIGRRGLKCTGTSCSNSCVVNVTAVSQSKSFNEATQVISKAISEVAIFVCKDALGQVGRIAKLDLEARADAASYAVAKISATATASVFSSVSYKGSCAYGSKGSVIASAQSVAWARATAEAYADAYAVIYGASASSLDGVKDAVNASAAAITESCAKAYASVFDNYTYPVGMPSAGWVTYTRPPVVDIATAMAKAVAKVFTSALAQFTIDVQDETFNCATYCPDCCKKIKTKPKANVCQPTSEVKSYPPVDVYFLADTTGSMGSAIANVKSNVAGITSKIVSPDSAFGVGEFKDTTDPFTFRSNAAIGSNPAAIQTAVNAWTASGGGDEAEGWVTALYKVATDPAIGWRGPATKIVVLFGDAPAHDPSAGNTLTGAVAALKAANITVVLVNVGGGHLDLNGQATLVANQTGGRYQPAAVDPAKLATTITSELNKQVSQFVSVSAAAGACSDPRYSLSFDPTSKTVASGTTACFRPLLSAVCPRSTGPVTCPVYILNSSGAIINSTTVIVA